MDEIEVGEKFNSIKYQADAISHMAESAQRTDFQLKGAVIERARRIIEIAESIPDDMWVKSKASK